MLLGIEQQNFYHWKSYPKLSHSNSCMLIENDAYIFNKTVSFNRRLQKRLKNVSFATDWAYPQKQLQLKFQLRYRLYVFDHM